MISGGEGLYINLFDEFGAVIACPGSQDSVSIRGAYTRDCRALITVDHRSQRAEGLPVRVAVWSEKSEICVNGETFKPAAGGWFKAMLAPNSVNLIEIAYDNTPRLPEDAWKCVRFCSRSETGMGNMNYEDMLFEPRCTLTMGPILLCRSKLIGNTEEEMFDAPSVFGQDCALALEDRRRPAISASLRRR